MNPKQFLAGLSITLLVQAVLNLVLILIEDSIKAHTGFIIVCMAALLMFCVMIYAAARIVTNSKLTRLYIQLIMIAVFLKMLVCLALVIGYTKKFHPSDNTFVWPFLFIYLTSTIYEVIFLEKVGRQKQNPVA